MGDCGDFCTLGSCKRVWPGRRMQRAELNHDDTKDTTRTRRNKETAVLEPQVSQLKPWLIVYISTYTLSRGVFERRESILGALRLLATRQFTRLTNAQSKSPHYHEAAVALWITWYNFGRVHSTRKMTPAVGSGLTSEAWTVERLLDELAAF